MEGAAQAAPFSFSAHLCHSAGSSLAELRYFVIS
jgi:hypothetical protein